jgi:cell division protein FtsZ
MKKYVDTLLVICNDKLREIYGNLKMSEAFAHADNVLTGAARAIAEIISMHLHINVDFNDVKTVMKDSGVAIMGTATASGDRRAIRAVEQALNSPLLNDNNIRGARHVLLNIMSGSDDISMDEFGEITDYIQEASGYTAELITGYGIDSTLGDNVGVTIIATGFQSNAPKGFEQQKQPERVVTVLEDAKTNVVEEPVKAVIQTDIVSAIEEVVEEKKDEPFLIIRQAEPAIEKQEPVAEEIENDNEETYIEPIAFANIPAVEETSSNREVEFVISNTASEENNEVVDEQPDFSNESAEEEITMELKEISIVSKAENPVGRKEEDSVQDSQLDREERIRLAQERIRKLKDMSLKLKSSEGLLELEKEPSFVRQNIKLDDVSYSKESHVSRYTLGEGDDKKTEIRPNNYLHDNVD